MYNTKWHRQVSMYQSTASASLEEASKYISSFEVLC